MASGDSRLFKGSFVGTGAALSIEAPGFKPRFVILVNVSDPALSLHIEGMADDSAWTQEDGASAYTTSDCVTLTSLGFDVGSDVQLNAASDVIHYICGS